jgi:hypothetical protein
MNYDAVNNRGSASGFNEPGGKEPMKRCQKCGRDWPSDGNFCPLDGANLVELEPPPGEEPEAAPEPPQVDPDVAISETLGDVGWEEKPAPEEPKKKKKKKKGNKREFSETQWFMVGDDPEELEDVKNPDELTVVSDKYDRDSTIPREVRKQYTLRKDQVNEDKSEDKS